MAANELYYPPVGFYFRVTFEKINTVAEDFRFQSVSGLQSEIVTETFREGGQNQFEHVLPVKAQYPDLVLKRGLLAPKTEAAGINENDKKGLEQIYQGALDFETKDVQQWCQRTIQTLFVQPTDIMITLLNSAGKPLMSWNVVHAWPKKWMVADFNAEENQIVIETMEFTYHYFRLI
ncbi:phage tail-like protein [Nitrosomonas nitrosa]|uniref:phage tail protein n=1 Tax=Nitrosomonas nitrosa TaxID=52442 RepID=UPI000D2F5002|nr:phage tail protein [Nitrosomonas nitrosa]PTQ91912.1 phage tail-like protein [Nitrosomonas nitrosa]